jgi:hypothetical protein
MTFNTGSSKRHGLSCAFLKKKYTKYTQRIERERDRETETDKWSDEGQRMQNLLCCLFSPKSKMIDRSKDNMG